MNETIRKRKLPEGWYPDTENSVISSIKDWEQKQAGITAKSVVVPHAGWYFSGRIASNTIKTLSAESDIIVAAGGHLSEFDSVLAAEEDKFETPLGYINNASDLLEKLFDSEIVKPDIVPDNTVEIQLPFIKYFFPESKLIWLRVPPEYNKVCEISKIIAEYEKNSGKKVSVIGSTDLTHYGINYGFMSHGSGEEALSWVKNVNDRQYIDCLIDYKIEESIKHSIDNRSACSSGGAALAAAYAEDSGCRDSEILYYYTSSDIYKADSFVGYAGLVFY